jgi:hypothetical protein
MKLSGLIVLILLLGPAAFAEPPPETITAPATKPDRGAFLLGLKAGGSFSEPFSPLGPSYLVDVEVGYVLPFLHRGLALVLDAGYTEPTASGGTTDPRVTANGGAYTWNLTQREVLVGFTVIYRLTMIGSGRVAPYLGVGAKLWLLQSKLVGAAGAGSPISESDEQSTKVGVSVPLGVDVGLGPGRIFVEAQLLWAPIDHRSTGDSSVGAITAALGYRLLL